MNISWSQTKPPLCENPEEKIIRRVDATKKQINSAKEYNDFYQIINDIQYMEKVVSKCNVNLEKINLSPNTFPYMRTAAYTFGINKLREEIENNSKYKDVSWELKKYKELASELKINTATIDEYIIKINNQRRATVEAEKKECQSVDLRNSALGEVRDQDSTGWCYAFAAADLLSYKLGKKISAADIAMKYNDQWINNLFKKVGGLGEHDFNGGWISEAINATNEKGGACLESNLRSEDNGYSILYSTLNDINEFTKKINTMNSYKCISAIKAIFPNLELNQINEAVNQFGRTELINALSDKNCKPRIDLSQLKISRHSASLERNRNQLLDEINKQFFKKNIVGISYNAQIFYNENSKGYKWHASTLVGRRFNKEKDRCEYLVRNSWGRGCSSYDPEYDCDQGNIWVPKATIFKGLRYVEYIE